jgi:hypothetical protein
LKTAKYNKRREIHISCSRIKGYGKMRANIKFTIRYNIKNFNRLLGEIYVIFIELCMKEVPITRLKGNNTRKKYNVRTNVENVQVVY